MTLHYDISELSPYINWVYYYFAWQVKQPDEQQRLRLEAEETLLQLEGRYHAHATFQIVEAYSDGDDIVVLRGERSEVRGERIPCLRQQEVGSEYLCLADFIQPLNTNLSPLTSHPSPLKSTIGLFATSVDSAMVTDFADDPYMKMMTQLLADRLAEAAAEKMHESVRRQYWGYAPDEQLTIDELHQEHFQGIRPAVGYPSLPDASINFILDRLIDFSQIGITLTENGAMRPHASVSGLMMAHPKAHYFSIGRIGTDQLNDYSQRRGLPVEQTRKYLAANI